METKAHNSYIKSEEIINTLSHGIGFILSIIALILLITKSLNLNSSAYLSSTLVYGFSLIFLYASSTLYHGIQKPTLRNRLNLMDHIAIYILIAGTYTPFTINTIEGSLGWIIFGIVWVFALVGIILKVFFFGRYNKLSALAYVVMGWIIVIGLKTLLEKLGLAGTIWLFSGGIFYTVGAIFYLFKKLPFNHAIFHFFVLAGSLCHFISIYWFVLI